MDLRIGFIGLGTMGQHMAAHLQRAGYHAIASDILAERLDPILRLGATRGESPRQMAEESDVVITMLPDLPDVKQVALGDDGILQAARPGLVHICIVSARVRQIGAAS